MGNGDRQYPRHKGFMRLIGDASNPTFGIAVDAPSGAIHLFDPPDWKTDWNVSASSDPSLYIHTASTNAATDYLRLYHNDSNGIIDCDGTTMISLTASTCAIANATTITTGGLTVTAGDVTVNSHLVFNTTAKAIKTAASNNADLSIQAYVTGSTAYASGIEIQSVTGGTVELGFFGKTPAAQQATEATVATSVAGYATINSLIGKLENLGLLATA